MKPYFIALGHYSRTGKDTLANAIVDRAATMWPGVAVKKLPMAWKLKDVCHQLYSWAGVREPEFYDTPEGEVARKTVLPELGLTPVELWIKFGTPAVRDQVYDLTWAKYLTECKLSANLIVVPDIRYQNEIDVLRETGRLWHLAKVIRPGYEPISDVDRALEHYRAWDAVYGRSGRIEDLVATGKFLMDRFVFQVL